MARTPTVPYPTDANRLEVADALDASDKLAQSLWASLARYEPERLGTYRHGNIWCSTLLEFLALLINGEWQRRPLTTSPLQHTLATSRLLFGSEAIEFRSPTRTRVGAMLGIKEYPTPTVVGMYDALLSAPFAFVLSQSLQFLTKASGQALWQRQFNRMANAGDFAISQAAQLKDALDALTSNEFVMGDHHFTLQIQADLADGVADDDERRLKGLNNHVALARSMLADTGMLVAREDLALEAAFGRNYPATSRCGRARRRSPRATSLPWCRFTISRVAVAKAITGARRSLCSSAVRSRRILFAACQRPARPGRRQSQGHRAHLDMRPDRLG